MRLARSRGWTVESEAPSKITSPVPGASSPASNRISVDFPEPFAPISAPIAPRGSDNETSTTAGNDEYENSKWSALISAPVVEESLGIRKTLWMKRPREHLRGVSNELAGMNHRGIGHRIDTLVANRAYFPKFIPYGYWVLTKIPFRALHHINDHFRV